jgi:hypothetical protein
MVDNINSDADPRALLRRAQNADQIGERAKSLGVDVRCESRVMSIMMAADSSEEAIVEEEEEVDESRDMRGGGDGGPGSGDFVVKFAARVRGTTTTTRTVRARSVVIATDVEAANSLLAGESGVIATSSSSYPTTPGMGGGSLSSLPPRRSVGCLYYGFASPAPILDPILILNGEGGNRRNTREYPINNVCFPSRVRDGHAPIGHELCCVSILENALAGHENDVDSLDASVRRQLASWFPDYENDIIDAGKWMRKGSYVIDNAQPANYHQWGVVDHHDDDVVICANVNGGRDCSTFRGITLPRGIYVCGDHMATSTLNGALESGVNAGDAAARFVLSRSRC